MAVMFTLWYPELSSDRTRCFIDVRQDNFVQLERGDRQVMAAFIEALGISATVSKWRVDSFCSPYYAGTAETTSWRDKVPRMWRVCVGFDRPYAGPDPEQSFGPVPVDCIDTTWRERDDSWNWTRCRSVVVAALADRDWQQFAIQASNVPGFPRCEAMDGAKLTPRLSQFRCDLGELDFPAGLPLVESAADAFRSCGASVHWSTTLHMALGLERSR